MFICFHIGGVEHCFEIPIVRWPWPPLPGPGPINYPQLFRDAMIVASVEASLEHIGDENVRNAMMAGVRSSVEAMEKHATYARISGIAGRK